MRLSVKRRALSTRRPTDNAFKAQPSLSSPAAEAVEKTASVSHHLAPTSSGCDPQRAIERLIPAVGDLKEIADADRVPADLTRNPTTKTADAPPAIDLLGENVGGVHQLQSVEDAVRLIAVPLAASANFSWQAEDETVRGSDSVTDVYDSLAMSGFRRDDDLADAVEATYGSAHLQRRRSPIGNVDEDDEDEDAPARPLVPVSSGLDHGASLHDSHIGDEHGADIWADILGNFTEDQNLALDNHYLQLTVPANPEVDPSPVDAVAETVTSVARQHSSIVQEPVSPDSENSHADIETAAHEKGKIQDPSSDVQKRPRIRDDAERPRSSNNVENPPARMAQSATLSSSGMTMKHKKTVKIPKNGTGSESERAVQATRANNSATQSSEKAKRAQPSAPPMPQPIFPAMPVNAFMDVSHNTLPRAKSSSFVQQQPCASTASRVSQDAPASDIASMHPHMFPHPHLQFMQQAQQPHLLPYPPNVMHFINTLHTAASNQRGWGPHIAHNKLPDLAPAPVPVASSAASNMSAIPTMALHSAFPRLAPAKLERHPILGRLQLSGSESNDRRSKSANADSSTRKVAVHNTQPLPEAVSMPLSDSRQASDSDGNLPLSPATKAAKERELRKRLVWTPELHDRFIKAVSAIGIHQAVPKVLVQIMNVDGLTTEHVKSHLQKYRNSVRKSATEALTNTGLADDAVQNESSANPGLQSNCSEAVPSERARLSSGDSDLHKTLAKSSLEVSGSAQVHASNSSPNACAAKDSSRSLEHGTSHPLSSGYKPSNVGSSQLGNSSCKDGIAPGFMQKASGEPSSLPNDPILPRKDRISLDEYDAVTTSKQGTNVGPSKGPLSLTDPSSGNTVSQNSEHRSGRKRPFSSMEPTLEGNDCHGGNGDESKQPHQCSRDVTQGSGLSEVMSDVDTARAGSRVDGCNEEVFATSIKPPSVADQLEVSSSAPHSPSPDRSRIEVHRQIEMQIEMQERTMQLQLQMQMMVHRTVSLQRKLQLILEKQAKHVSVGTATGDLSAEHSALISEQRAMERELERQQALLKLQMDAQEKVRQQLIDDSKNMKEANSSFFA